MAVSVRDGQACIWVSGQMVPIVVPEGWSLIVQDVCETTLPETLIKTTIRREKD
jgi:hypothetical protein